MLSKSVPSATNYCCPARINMKSNALSRIRLAQILLGAMIVLGLVVVHRTSAANGAVHLTTDWSHRHLIYSAPHNLAEHIRLLSKPRYVQQMIRRNAGRNGDPEAWRWRHARHG